MILKGGIPGVIAKPGPGLGHGITPAQISTAGNADSPLLNDVDPGDDATQFIWALLPPLISTGTTRVDDLGGYALEAPSAGIWSQAYRLLAMPATGAAVVDEATIVTSVASSVPPVFGPAVTSWTVRTALPRIGSATIRRG
jgi:hypothetical protein